MASGFIALAPSVSAPRPASSAGVFLQTLADAGVRAVFGIPGGTASPLFATLADVSELRYVATRHEAGAGFAALGYARATRKPAVVLTTSGPGVTNTMTAVASADSEDLPLIVVSGEIPMRAFGRGALQDGTSLGWSAIEAMRPITRWAGSLACPTAAVGVATKAYQASTRPRPGPVFVSVPLDIGGAVAPQASVYPSVPPECDDVDAAACASIAGVLSRSRRPLLILGSGARKASEPAQRLAERLTLPVVVTGHAKGAFPERHPLYLGIVGLGQHPSVDEYLLERPDVTIAVGTRLNDLATNGWSLPLIGSLASIQIDRDPLVLGRSQSFSHLVVGDAARVLGSILSALAEDVGRPRRRYPAFRKLRPELERCDDVPLKPPRVLRAVAEAWPDAVWCSDIGEHLAYALHYLAVDDPGSFHNFLGFGSMGSGVGAALGLQLARPDRQVVCVCGDGGFAMMLGELLTCVEQRLGVVFVVMNDGRWNMVEHGFRHVYGRVPDGVISAIADFSGVAAAMGALGHRVASIDQLDPVLLREMTSHGRPVVLDVRIDAAESLTPGTRAASIRHFCADQ